MSSDTVDPPSACNGDICDVALSAGRLTRIIVSTAYREDYVLAPKALSRDRNPVPYVRMLSRAAAISGWLRCTPEDACLAQLHKSNALMRANEAKLKFGKT